MKKSQSPQPLEKMLTFSEAIKQTMIGKKIHKLQWKNKEYYGFIDNGKLRLHKQNGRIYDWIISEEDLEGKHWIIL